MKQKRHSADQIVSKLRKADVELGKGKKVPKVCKELEVTEQTYYRWHQDAPVQPKDYQIKLLPYCCEHRQEKEAKTWLE